MAVVLQEALNGHHYLGLQEGETLRAALANTYIFRHDTPVAENPMEEVNFTQEQSDQFLRANVEHLDSLAVGTKKLFTLQQCSIIAYHRLLAVRDGLVSPRFLPANFHVDYTETRVKTDNELKAMKVVDMAQVKGFLPDQLQMDISESFYDRVCLIAFVFRARGHHYMEGYEELYRRVWQKCRYDVNSLQISFQNLATSALHAIYPVILEEYWSEGVKNSYVNGALAKRFDVAPAGAAGPYVLKQGIDDLLMVAPGVRDRLLAASEYLGQVLVELSGHRYNGSVNARYYGAKKVHFAENRLGSIAATIKAALDNLTDDAPLGKSPALERIANNAPITGAVLGRAIGAIANRPEVVNGLLEAPE